MDKLEGYEHIEVCSSCGERYLEKLPKQRGAKYLCPKCYEALKSARLGAATLVCPYCGKSITVQISEGEEEGKEIYVPPIPEAPQHPTEGVKKLCDNCGQPIEPVRLKNLPQANLCLSCKVLEEKKAKDDKRHKRKN